MAALFPGREDEVCHFDRRIEALNHEAHAEKPLALQHKALEARLARCEINQEKAAVQLQEAHLAQEVAAKAALDASSRATELAREAAELVVAVRDMAITIARQDPTAES